MGKVESFFPITARSGTKVSQLLGQYFGVGEWECRRRHEEFSHLLFRKPREELVYFINAFVAHRSNLIG
ncbi:MAG: hypothetical protein HC888_03970 [Candidatus Competibacteraceae bacterium]|nr:hypothetical protein [Candidatus Competibacteraceae bacterium]